MLANNSPPATAIPLVSALVCHAQQMSDERLLLTARITPPPDKVSEHGELIRKEREHFHYALENEFTFGGMFHDLKTIVTFQPLEHFHAGMIETFPLTSFPSSTRLPGRSTNYERMVQKAENGAQIPNQVAAAIDDFLCHAAAGELATFWGKQNNMAAPWIKIPLDTLYGTPITIHWGNGTICINSDQLCCVRIKMPAKAALVPSRRRGRPHTRDDVDRAMAAMPREELEAMKQAEMKVIFKASESTCRAKREKILGGN